MDKKIHIVFQTHQGVLYDESVDHFVCKSKSGEFAVYPDHVSVITVIEKGAVKIVNGSLELYVSLSNAIIEFHENEAKVLAQEAFVGRDMDSAAKNLADARNDRLNENRKLDADYAKNERDIVENLKNAKAGQL